MLIRTIRGILYQHNQFYGVENMNGDTKNNYLA